MFSGFYCKKCNIIPLVRPNLFDKKSINFTVKCKCSTKFLTYDKLYNNYYSKNIEQKTIINEKILEEIIENKEPILQKIEEFVSTIRNNNDQFNRLKNKFIDYMNSFINKIGKSIDKLMNIYENIEKVSLIFIDSYKIISTNYSNFTNINFILDNEIDKIDESNINNLFNEYNCKETINNIKEYIDQYSLVNQQLKYFSRINIREISDIIILSNELLLMEGKEYLYFFSIKDLKIIGKIKGDSIINISKTQNNNILCLFPEWFEIYPEITYNYINSVKIENKNENENEKVDYYYEDDFDNKLLFDIEPLMKFNLHKKYYKILNWIDENYEININKFLLYNENMIDFFECDLFKKIVIKYHSYNINLFKIELIKYKKKNTLILFTPSNLLLFDLFSLNIIGKFEMIIKEDDKITIVQINDDELLFAINKYIYILNLKYFKIKLKIKYENKIDYAFLFNDKSIIICGITRAKKFSPKTFEVLCNFYISKEDYYDCPSDWESYEYNNRTRYFNCIYKCIELRNSIFLLLLSNGECELNKLII